MVVVVVGRPQQRRREDMRELHGEAEEDGIEQ